MSTPFEGDPVIEAYKKDVDRTLLRANLRKTVTERLEALMELRRLADEARRAGRKPKPHRSKLLRLYPR